MSYYIFNTIAITATAGFVLGIISGYLPLIIISLLLAGLFYWLMTKIS